MQFFAISSILVVTVFIAIAVYFGVFASFAGNSGKILRIEAENENVTVYINDGKYAQSAAKSTDVDSNNRASGNKYVTGLGKTGGSVTWAFYADDDVSADIFFAVANAINGASAFEAGGGELFSVVLNDALYLPDAYTLSEGTRYGDQWESMKLSSVPIVKGLNFITMEIATDAPTFNLDFISIDAYGIPLRAHVHDYNKTIIPVTCESDGEMACACDECGINFVRHLSKATGHIYGTYHYSDETQNMVCYCRNCGQLGEEKTPPTSKYFGEVFEKREMLEVYPKLRAFETVFEAEDAAVNLSGGLNNGTSYYDYPEGAHGGACIANISKVGNSVTFNVQSQRQQTADLVLVLSNVKYGTEGIAPLDPMSKFVSVTVNNGTINEVDFTYVSFPGDIDYNYFNWRYVVIRNVELTDGRNSIVLRPKANQEDVTIPNIDALYLYTDELNDIIPLKSYEMSGVYSDSGFSPSFTKAFDVHNDNVYKLTMLSKMTGHLMLDINVQGVNSDTMSIMYNGKRVNCKNLSMTEGKNRIIIPNVEFDLENFFVIRLPQAVSLENVFACTNKPMI